jgi:hypothetical protein
MTGGAKFDPDDIKALIEWLKGESKKGTPRDLQARRTLARALRSSLPLDPGLRFVLAEAVDPDGEDEVRLFLERKREPGRQLRLNKCKIAVFIWRQRQAGTPWESAVRLAMKEFRCSRGTVTGAWKEWRRFIERHPDVYLNA